MRHFAIPSFVAIVALLCACGLPPEAPEDPEDVGESSEELVLDPGPIFAQRPAISSFSPTSAAPGATVTINGSGFDTLFRGPAAFGSATNTAARATLTYVSPTQMTAVVPAGAVQGPIYILSSITLIGQTTLPIQVTSSQSFTPLFPPAAPSGLAAHVVSSTRIDLTWTDGSSNETGFDVWILDSTGWHSLHTVAANRTSDGVTGLHATTAYSFRVRAQNASGSSAFSNTVSATTPAALGTLVLTNNAQISVTAFTLNGVAQSATSVSGNQATFRVAPGSYTAEAELSLANGDWVCSLGGPTTVVENQTSSVTVAALGAGQVLTHCSGSIDYTQGSYVDAAGFHTVSMRFYSTNAFDWWLDAVLQPRGTITSTNFADPWLTFTLSTGDTISMGWPFGSVLIDVNGHSVQMTRASGW